MNYFQTRKANEKIFFDEHARKAKLIDAGYNFIDELLETCNANIKTRFYRVVGTTILKGKIYSLSCFSLVLDGHGQEAGAMSRTWWEYIDLLNYFQEDPSRVSQTDSGLPKPGKISQKYNPELHGMRSHFSEHASHRAFSDHATAHLFNENGKLRIDQNPIEGVLLKNVTDFYTQLWLFLARAHAYLSQKDHAGARIRANRVHNLRIKGTMEFKL